MEYIIEGLKEEDLKEVKGGGGIDPNPSCLMFSPAQPCSQLY